MKRTLEVLAKEFPHIRKLYKYQDEVLAYLTLGGNRDANKSQATAISSFAPQANDLLIYSPTGFGKTLAYVLPILHYIKSTKRKGDAFTHSRRPDGVSALVLVPTKDLAIQVFTVIEPVLGSQVVLLSGEKTFQEECKDLQSTAHGQSGPDVVVSVASRLALHAEPTGRIGNSCRWNTLRYLVIDEADRLLADTYGNWITALRHITKDSDEMRGAIGHHIPLRPDVLTEFWDHQGKQLSTEDLTDCHPCSESVDSGSFNASSIVRPFMLQKIICTATDIKSFKGMRTLRLYKPLCIRAHLEEDRLKQKIVGGSADEKDRLMKTLTKILSKARNKCLVFCKSVNEARHVYKSISAQQDNDIVGLLTGLDSPKARRRLLERFETSDIRLLISTDVTARGLNIRKITHVVQYGLPVNADEYIHRIGRTARCGKKGRSILILTKSEISKYRRMRDQIINLRPTSRINEKSFLK